MRVIEVTERSAIDLSETDILSSSGKVLIRNDLIARGLVEVRQSKFSLKLRIHGVVGRLQITDGLALDIRPKFSISNLNHLIYSSRLEIKKPFDLLRPYEQSTQREYLPVPLVRTFTQSLTELTARGVQKKYLHTLHDASPKPKIDFSKSNQKYWSKLKPTMAVLETFEFTRDHLANQLLKAAVRRAIAISHLHEQLSATIPHLAEVARDFQRVSDVNISNLTSLQLAMDRDIPDHRGDYRRCLLLALEILRGADHNLETSELGTKLESYIICLDDVFERFIRHILRTFINVDGQKLDTVDGNLRKHQKSLFSDNNKYKIKPDLIIRNARNPIIIGDVKYKTKPKEDDRYQIIAHTLGYGLSKALLIYPRLNEHSIHGLNRLGFVGRDERAIEIYEYFFDLAGDLQAEENNLRNVLGQIARVN